MIISNMNDSYDDEAELNYLCAILWQWIGQFSKRMGQSHILLSLNYMIIMLIGDYSLTSIITPCMSVAVVNVS